MRFRLLPLLSLLARHAADDTIRIPIQVDQAGRTVDFASAADADVAAEAAAFCVEHLPMAPRDECATNLVEQVRILRGVRAKAAGTLPGLSFNVQDENGQQVKFTHVEGQNPAEEVHEFCEAHFPSIDSDSCAEAMLKNAQKALDEANAEHEARQAEKAEL